MQIKQLHLFKRENSIYTAGLFYSGIASAAVWWIGFTQPAYIFSLARIPRLDIVYMLVGGGQALLRLGLSLLVLTASYWLASRWAGSARGKLAWAAVAAGFLLQAGVLLFMAPISSTDIFDNILHGRILAVYHANPFQQTPAMFPADPFARFVGWPNATSAYGPLWEAAAGLTSWLAGSGFIANILAFKLLPGLFWVGCVAVTALILRRHSPTRALQGAVFLAWNPVAMFEIFGNGHNDPAFLFWVLLAVWAVLERRYITAVLMLVVGALVKFMPALLIPAVVLIALRALPGWKQRLSYLLRTTTASAGVSFAAYLPFWVGLDTLSLGRRAQLFATSLPSSLVKIISPYLGAGQAEMVISRLAALLAVGFAVWMAFRAAKSRSPDRFAAAGLVIFGFYLLAADQFFWPWYTIWLIALAPLVRDRHLRILALIFGFAALSKDFLSYLGADGSLPTIPQPWMEIWLTVRIMLIPWAYAIYVLIARRRSAREKPPFTPATARTREEYRESKSGR